MKNLLQFILCLSIMATCYGAERYFPDGSLGRKPALHEYMHKSYAGKLKAFEEPSLMTVVEKGDANGKTIYRFTWLRTFHNPISIRLVKGDTITLTAKALDGKGGYEFGKLTTNVTKEISPEQFAHFESLLDEADYRFLTPHITQEGAWHWIPERNFWSRVHGAGYDGAQWILEYCSDNRYYFVSRWSPAESRFGKACLYLVELSELKVDDVY